MRERCDILIIRTDEIIAELVDAMPRLRLIQALTTGTDHIEALPNLPPHVMIAAARGFHGPQMSELAFIFMLHFVRDFRDLFATQDAQRWNRRRAARSLADRTVVIVGVGAIAEELAQALQGVRHARRRRERRPHAAPHFDADATARAARRGRRAGGFPDRAGAAHARRTIISSTPPCSTP